ncbi:MAG: DUF898 domain-containing protein [Methylobacillus sp.]|jgi:uncharacterized membrane protein YjgN (DUF898 family)|nr:DUF898 domain-containing protein [Methylobacillus sp.]
MEQGQEQQPEPRREPVVFSGTGAEYFRIWIINLCLSIITLGIYSAWAKVRRMKYFYQHTSVAGANFDFHGSPLAILKGRIIAVILLAIYWGAPEIAKWAAAEEYKLGTSEMVNTVIHYVLLSLGPIAFVLIMALMPWLLVRSMRFRFSNTSYRGLRGSFHGKISEAYLNFLLLPIVTIFTLGLLWPMVKQMIVKYVISNSRYGSEHFDFRAGAGDFYVAYLIAYACAMGISMVAIILVTVLMFAGTFTGMLLGGGSLMFMILSVLLYLPAYIAVLILTGPFLAARLQNIIWSGASVGSVAFESKVSARALIKIVVVNVLLILVTLGLYKPFADIRVARYRLESGTMLVGGDLDQFVAGAQTSAGAAGEEIADFFDFDISL